MLICQQHKSKVNDEIFTGKNEKILNSKIQSMINITSMSETKIEGFGWFDLINS